MSPLFILGAPRSGTSLLYKLLCLHPDAAFISNYVHRVPAAPQLAALNRVARRLPAAQMGVWFGRDSNAYVYGGRRPLRQRLVPMPSEGEPVFRRAGLPADPADARDGDGPARRAALRRTYASLSAFGGGSVVISKRIGHNRRIPLLQDAFPDARYLNLTRDGRAVALSLSRVDWWPELVVWWYGGTPGQWAAEGRDPWELCARHWVEEVRVIDEGLVQVPSESVLNLSYEDLVADPLPVLDAIAAFARLSEDAGWRSRLRTMSFPNKNDAWRDKLDDQARLCIESVQAEELSRRGYAV